MAKTKNRYSGPCRRIIAIASAAVLLGCWNADQTQNHVKFVGSWGSEGTRDGQFLYIEDFAISADGHLLVTDALRSDVQIFTKDGKFLGKFGGKGNAPANFEKPEGVAVAPNGNIFVADYLSGYIKIFDSDYNHLRNFSSLWGRRRRDYRVRIHVDFPKESPLCR